MNVVLLRIGIDTGSGGIHGPLFADGTFEYIPIPDRQGVDERTYGNTVGRCGRNLIDYFPASMQGRMANQPMHVDPEFESFTYGDPTPPKAGLRRLNPGDLLVFYCGLKGWECPSDPALYLMGFFEVERAGRATEFTKAERDRFFSSNFHVRHRRVFKRQRESLVLVKGTSDSRLLEKPLRISAEGTDRAGKPLKVLSSEMRRIFGDFSGRVSIQRSPPRWVEPDFVAGAADFVRALGSERRPRNSVAPWSSPKPLNVARGDPNVAEPKVYFVHLRRPKNKPDETRADPFYEFGSFGCTACHHSNLMHPRHAAELQGARLAFVQGGPFGSRLVFLTPPIKVKKWKNNCEARWTPPEMPFKYQEAPILVSNDGQTDFPPVKKFALQADGKTVEGSFCSKIRSLATPLEPKLAKEVINVYERKRAKALPTAIATKYYEALPWPPPQPDRKRKTTYQFFIAQREAESNELDGASQKKKSRCGATARRKSSCETD